MSTPWKEDADLLPIHCDEIKDPAKEFILVHTKAVNDFVSSDPHDMKFFVVGSKGTGKTLLLKYKSAHYRRQKAGTTFLPENELCEQISATNVALPESKINAFKEVEHWKAIWLLCLSCAVICRNGLSLPLEIANISGNASSVGDFLQIFLDERSNIFEFSRLRASHLNHSLNSIKTNVAVFVDTIDEAMDKHVGHSLSEARLKKNRRLGMLDEEVWVASQLGFIEAARAIHQVNSHIKVFAAIRIEALNANQMATSMQTKAYCAILSYSEQEVREIFEANIREVNSDNMVSPQSETLMERFLGFSMVTNKCVKDAFGRFVQEEAFSYMFRHTFGRPREIVHLGSAIASLDKTARTSDAVARLVNERAGMFFTQYKKETIPFWHEENENVILSLMDTNVYSFGELQTLSTTITDQTGVEHPFCDWYRRGLLGNIESQHWDHSKLIQHFLPAGEHSCVESCTLPPSPSYVLHPCIEESLRHFHTTNLAINEKIVVGNNLSFPHDGEATNTRHVHFGAGNLGLGLVIPLLADNHALCIIQRPSKDWENLIDASISSTILFHESSKYRFLLLHDKMELGEKQGAISEWLNGKHLLCLCEDQEILLRVCSEAASYSTTLKNNAAFEKYANLLKVIPFENTRQIYCFENDRGVVNCFRKSLSEYIPAFEVVHVLADRICTDKRVSKDGIKVSVESRFNLVVCNSSSKSADFFNKIPNVTLARTEDEWNFLYEKKIHMVNGIHAMMALCQCGKLAAKHLDRSKWKDQVLVIDEDNSLIRMTAIIQACRLIFDHRKTLSVSSPEQKLEDHYLMLTNYATDIFKRMNVAQDTLGRVLGLLDDGSGVESGSVQQLKRLVDRFNGRCSGIIDFVHQSWPEVQRWGFDNLPEQSEILREIDMFQRSILKIVTACLSEH